MPLGRGIVELFEAIPERIEVSGQAPTWRVTGGSFESVLDYVRSAYGEAAVIAREDRTRWWHRVTLTVTVDPELAAGAPAPDVFAAPVTPAAPTGASTEASTEPSDTPSRTSTAPRHAAEVPAQRRSGEQRAEPRSAEPGDGAAAEQGPFAGVLDEIFAHQEALRRERMGLSRQRSSDA